MKNFLKKYIKNKQIRVFLSSFTFLLICACLSSYWIDSKQIQALETPPSSAPPKVFVSTIKKANYPIQLDLYGTAKAGHSFTLKAPTSGKIIGIEDLYPGKVLAAGAPLIEIENEKIMRCLSAKQSEKAKGKLAIEKIQQRASFLERDEGIAKQQVELCEESIHRRNEQLSIEKEQFECCEQLFQKGVLAKNEFQRKRSLFLGTQLELLRAKEQQQMALKALQAIQNEKEQQHYSIEEIELNIATIEKEIEQLEDDFSRTIISTPRQAKLLSVDVDLNDEVGTGQALLTLQDNEYVDITVQLPDAYFQWLYKGAFWADLKQVVVSLDLVNSKLNKKFSDAFIQSMGPQLQESSRSLPLLIRRFNSSHSIEEEIIPGMYFKVGLQLHTLEGIYQIPEAALQENGHIYALQKDLTIKDISNFEILFEDDQGYVLQINEDIEEEFSLITHSLRGGYEGMAVKLQGEVSV